MRVALVSRELYPLRPGGIGQFVSAAASALGEVGEVTVVTSSNNETLYNQLVAARDRRLPPKRVRIAFVPEPSEAEAGGWTCLMHCYSARVYERLKQLYPGGGPELIEFPDYLGEGFVTVQAARALDPFLSATRVCVRLHTTREMCQVLNAYLPADAPHKALHALERFSLRHADRVIWEGGDVLGAYERFYGPDALAPAVRIRYPYRGPVGHPRNDADYEPGSAALRLVYPGRLERRKGVRALVRAACSLGRGDFHLRLIGSDTDTGPLGVSIRELLELEAAGDPRIAIESGDGLGREALATAIRSSDVVVIPSLWECWPYTALEALHLNRPVLATPVGGLLELVSPGASGWLASGTDWVSLAAALERVLDDRRQLGELVRSGRPAQFVRGVADNRQIARSYVELAREARPRRRPTGARPPLVSAIVPYFKAAEFVSETVRSLREQTYRRLEIVLVNDGSFCEQDLVIAELASNLPVVVVSQMNAGLGAARNFGIQQSRGRYFFPLDADNIAEPEFVERCVKVLEARPDVAYVTSWSRYIDHHGQPRTAGDIGYQPLGNEAQLSETESVAGDAAAVVRRRLFDAGFRYNEELTSIEDWAFYRRLRAAGHHGAVIPERLLRYRIRRDSMQARIGVPNRALLEEEIAALLRESAVRWTWSQAGMSALR